MSKEPVISVNRNRGEFSAAEERVAACADALGGYWANECKRRRLTKEDAIAALASALGNAHLAFPAEHTAAVRRNVAALAESIACEMRASLGEAAAPPATQ